MRVIPRLFAMPEVRDRSVFLWGPRKTGKTSWIREHLPDCPLIDLLKSEVYAEYASRPQLLRERFGQMPPARWVVLDEVQRVPALLDEVHWLIENRGAQFLLTGSSARKLRRGQANLLGGRAWRRELRPLALKEVLDFRPESSLPAVARSGLLPSHFLSQDPQEDLRSYVADYLKEEIAAEGLTRNLPAFSEFLRVAAVTNGELLNYENVARECAVSAKVVRGYFGILDDTLLGFRLPGWRKSLGRRLLHTEKFYFFDVGVANFLARRNPVEGSGDLGKSLEHLVLAELLAYRAYRSPDLEVAYWRTSTGFEVDFLLQDRALAIEVKGSARVHETDLRSLTALCDDGPVGQRVIVCQEREPRVLQDRYGPVLVLPWRGFVERLWQGGLLTA